MASNTEKRKIERKQKRSQFLIASDAGIKCTDQPTQNLAICNAGLSTGMQQETLLKELSQYGSVLDIILLRYKSYCFVKCENTNSAINIYDNVNGKSPLGQYDGVLYLTYCDQVPKIENSNQTELPPGLIILNDFVTIDEENLLCESIDWTITSADSCGQTLKHRQVKHFGYEFLYESNLVNINKPLALKIPKECDVLWKKLQANENVLSLPGTIPDQLTVNKYQPGQGIPPHVDTHSAFLETIIVLSLGSAVVMEFHQPKQHCNTRVKSENNNDKHASVFVPQRSLMIMSGESRYGWTHGITPKKIDVIHNDKGHLTTKERKTRISFTFRWLKHVPCNCKFPTLCNSQISRETNDDDENAMKSPSALELENVHNVYDKIADHFSETRHSPWPKVQEFIDKLLPGSILLDIGCGNGKYLGLNNDSLKIGCDRSNGLLNVCRDRGLNVFQCDCLAVPIKSNSIDACISIAVIHHLASNERRIQAIQEMARILVPSGRALIYVWAKNQAVKTKSSYLRQNKRNNKKCNENDVIEKKIDEKVKNGLPIHTNRTEFEHQDVLVPWKLKAKKNENIAEILDETDTIKTESLTTNFSTLLRYYHVFEENELEQLCGKVNNIFIRESYYDQGNWCVIFEKTF